MGGPGHKGEYIVIESEVAAMQQGQKGGQEVTKDHLANTYRL
jgi:hypothetical protein